MKIKTIPYKTRHLIVDFDRLTALCKNLAAKKQNFQSDKELSSKLNKELSKYSKAFDSLVKSMELKTVRHKKSAQFHFKKQKLLLELHNLFYSETLEYLNSKRIDFKFKFSHSFSFFDKKIQTRYTNEEIYGKILEMFQKSFDLGFNNFSVEDIYNTYSWNVLSSKEAARICFNFLKSNSRELGLNEFFSGASIENALREQLSRSSIKTKESLEKDMEFFKSF